VTEFRGLDNVMGYNPINEPLEISMLVPGLFDKKLFAFYEKWIVAMRRLDPDRPACLEPATVNMVIPFMPPRTGHGNLVYAPHPYYIHSGSFVLKEPNAVLDMKYKRIDREARRLNAPLIIGEYGGDPDTEYARNWLTRSFELRDQYFAGAAIWVYDASNTGWAIVDADLKPRPFFAKALNRPYPRHTAGKPLELKYKVESRAFTYRYTPDHKISAPTVIYLPSGPDQASVSIKGGSWTYDDNSRVLLVRPDPGVAEVLIEARLP
jgi:endoglycosylceramidase